MAKFTYRKKHKVAKTTDEYSYKEISLTKMAKRQLMVTIFSILGVTMLSLGSAYAAFTSISKSSNYNVIKVGTLNIDFGTDSNNTINLNGQYPVADSVGLASTPYTFTITNSGTVTAGVKVKILDDTDMITSDGCSSNQLNKNYIKYSLDGSTVGVLTDLGSEAVISAQNLAAGKSVTYKIRVWIAGDAKNDVLNKHYHGKIVVEGTSDQEMPMMKSYGYSTIFGQTSVVDDYHAEAYRTKITSIVTKTNTMVPQTAIQNWDVSANRDNTVIAYVEDDGKGTGTYKLTLGATGGIQAHPDSSYLFAGFQAVTAMDLSHLDTSNVVNMSFMFYNCRALTSLNLSTFNTAKVTDMKYMFCSSNLSASLNLSSFDTSKVTNMQNMFESVSIVTLDLTSFDTSNVMEFGRMFYLNDTLRTINVSSKWVIRPDASTSSMFQDCSVSGVTVV